MQTDLVVRVLAEQARIVADQMSCFGFVKKQNKQQKLLEREFSQSLLVA